MVLIVAGDSEIDAHVRSHLCVVFYLFKVSDLRAVEKILFFSSPKILIFLQLCETFSELLFYTSMHHGVAIGNLKRALIVQ